MRTLLGFALTALLVTPAQAGSGNQIKLFLLNTGVQPRATGKLVFNSSTSQQVVRLSVSRLTQGAYEVILNGAVVDRLIVNSKGKGLLRHKSIAATKQRSASALPFDPRGGEIMIASAGTAVLEGDVPETPEEGQEHVEIEADLTNLGVVSGEAEASFESRSGRMQFEVELEGVPRGTYDLLVDGVNQGAISAGIDNEGRIEFDSMPSVGDDDDDEQGDDQGTLDTLLTFDPRGKLVVIEQNGVQLFSTLFPTQGTGRHDDEGEDQDDDHQGDQDGGGD